MVPIPTYTVTYTETRYIFEHSILLLSLLLKCFSILPNEYFVVSLRMKVIFHGAGNDSKYRDVAPSTYIETSARKLFWAIKTECPKT